MEKERFVNRLITTTAAFGREITYTSAYDRAIVDELIELPLSQRKSYLGNFHVINSECEQLFERLMVELKVVDTEIRFEDFDAVLRKVEKDWEKLSFLFSLTSDEKEGVRKVVKGMRRHANENTQSVLGLMQSYQDFMVWLFEARLSVKVGSRYDAILQTAGVTVVEEIAFFIASLLKSSTIKANLRRLLLLHIARERVRPKAAYEGDNSIHRLIQRVTGTGP